MQRRKFLTSLVALPFLGLPVAESATVNFADVRTALVEIGLYCKIHNVDHVLVLCSFDFQDRAYEFMASERCMTNTLCINKGEHFGREGLEFGRGVLVAENSFTGSRLQFSEWNGTGLMNYVNLNPKFQREQKA